MTVTAYIDDKITKQGGGWGSGLSEIKRRRTVYEQTLIGKSHPPPTHPFKSLYRVQIAWNHSWAEGA